MNVSKTLITLILALLHPLKHLTVVLRFGTPSPYSRNVFIEDSSSPGLGAATMAIPVARFPMEIS